MKRGPLSPLLTAENQGLSQVQDNTDVMTLAYNFERIWECGLKLHLSFRRTLDTTQKGRQAGRMRGG